MLPPPDASYPSSTALLADVRNFAHAQGYAVSILHSDRRKVVIKCDRGGVYIRRAQADQEPVRKCASRLMGCPFRAKGRLQKDSTWNLRTNVAEHNHAASIDMNEHPTLRRLQPEQKTLTNQILRAGIAFRDIIPSLRQIEPSTLATGRTIYNQRKQIRQEELFNQTPMEALLNKLIEDGWNPQVKLENGRQTHLFYASPKSVQLLHQYLYALTMDCTYKTNRYKMPLFHNIGMTSFITSFTVAIAFLKQEQEADYSWALENLAGIFGTTLPITITTDRDLALMNALPQHFSCSAHLLCIWHINKNILANCRKIFTSDEDWLKFMQNWSSLVSSDSTATYNKKLEEMLISYSSIPEMMIYLQNTWLIFKEKFVHTNNKMHFGIVTSSRGEGLHRRMKMYIGVSTRDLYDVHIRISHAIEAQIQNHSSRLSKERIRIFHKHKTHLFGHIIPRISAYALNKVFEQYELAKYATTTSTCTYVFNKTTGIPRQHQIQAMITNNTPLTVLDFHCLWHLDAAAPPPPDQQEVNSSTEMVLDPSLAAVRQRYQIVGPHQKYQILEQLTGIVVETPVPMLNPATVERTRGRPPGSSSQRAFVNTSSTQRDPSLFEHVPNATHPGPSRRHCGICKVIGHNARSCPQRLLFPP